MTDYKLVSPADPTAWRSYHDIRRQVLFEGRGHVGVYNENHPDERAPGHHPKVLLFQDDLVGVIRIDIAAPHAIFRRVAIRADVQRCGHGRALLSLAERFAAAHKCRQLLSYVASDAVGFYQRCGFAVDLSHIANDEGAVLMQKSL